MLNVSEAVEALGTQATENMLGAVALVIAICSFVYAAMTNRRIERRELALRTSAVYMELEAHSSGIFAFTAANAEAMRRFRCHERQLDFEWEAERYEKQRETTLNLYYQTLNLFEVCTRMRRENLFPREVFASWVAWFLEVLEDWYFREMWPEIRTNYTVDVRRIFDLGWDIFRHDMTPEQRASAFYQAVATVMENPKEGECGDIAAWPAAMKDVARWRTETDTGQGSTGTTARTPPVLQPHFQPG